MGKKEKKKARKKLRVRVRQWAHTHKPTARQVFAHELASTTAAG
jgi:hypothetical protein